MITVTDANIAIPRLKRPKAEPVPQPKPDLEDYINQTRLGLKYIEQFKEKLQ